MAIIDSALDPLSSNGVQNKVITAALNAKQDMLEFDDVPTKNSTKVLSSGTLSTITADISSTFATLKTNISNSINSKGGSTTVNQSLSELNNALSGLIGVRDPFCDSVPTLVSFSTIADNYYATGTPVLSDIITAFGLNSIDISEIDVTGIQNETILGALYYTDKYFGIVVSYTSDGYTNFYPYINKIARGLNSNPYGIPVSQKDSYIYGIKLNNGLIFVGSNQYFVVGNDCSNTRWAEMDYALCYNGSNNTFITQDYTDGNISANPSSAELSGDSLSNNYILYYPCYFGLSYMAPDGQQYTACRVRSMKRYLMNTTLSEKVMTNKEGTAIFLKDFNIVVGVST